MNQKTWLNTNRINEHFHFCTQDVLFIMFFWNIYEFLMLKIHTDFFFLYKTQLVNSQSRIVSNMHNNLLGFHLYHDSEFCFLADTCPQSLHVLLVFTRKLINVKTTTRVSNMAHGPSLQNNHNIRSSAGEFLLNNLMVYY